LITRRSLRINPRAAQDFHQRFTGFGPGKSATVSSSTNGNRTHRHPVAEFPSAVTERVGFFDRFAGHAADIASRAPFFAFCVLLVVIWAPSYFVFQSIDTWQLIINTATTIVTFLMVAVLQNSQTRSDQAVQHKLNAIADGLADLMEGLADVHDREKLKGDVEELKRAVGLERIESTS
jgi:low affinity iron permease